MNFKALQDRFRNMHMDTRSQWISGGTNNKESINNGFKEVFEKFISTLSGEKLMRTEKYKLTFTDNIANLPTDFRTIARDDEGNTLFIKSGNEYYQMGESISYEIRYGDPYQIVFKKAPIQDIYIDYVKKQTDLSLDIDIPNLPINLHESIIDYALIDYFRQQRDWNNVGASLQYAEGKVKERMDNIWLN